MKHEGFVWEHPYGWCSIFLERDRVIPKNINLGTILKTQPTNQPSANKLLFQAILETDKFMLRKLAVRNHYKHLVMQKNYFILNSCLIETLETIYSSVSKWAVAC